MEFEHSKEQGIEAMQNLIKHTDYTEQDFDYSDDLDAELGLEIGTPLIKTTGDDFIVTAYDHWQNWLQMQDPSFDDDYVEYFNI